MRTDQVLNEEALPAGTSAEGVRDALDIRDVVYRADASFDWHDHEHASLFVVLSGGVREQWGSTGATCARGTVGFIPAAGRHRSRFGRTTTHTLSITLRDAWLRRLGIEPKTQPNPGAVQNEFVAAAAMRLHAACRWRDAARWLATEELITELLGWTNGVAIGDARAAMRRRRTRTRLDRVADVLRTPGGERVGLGALSAMADRHPAHLCREFRTAFGCSLTDFVMLSRVERACVLLRTTARSLASVGLEAGFYDQAQFGRAFRRWMGATPGMYRTSYGLAPAGK